MEYTKNRRFNIIYYIKMRITYIDKQHKIVI